MMVPLLNWFFSKGYHLSDRLNNISQRSNGRKNKLRKFARKWLHRNFEKAPSLPLFTIVSRNFNCDCLQWSSIMQNIFVQNRVKDAVFQLCWQWWIRTSLGGEQGGHEFSNIIETEEATSHSTLLRVKSGQRLWPLLQNESSSVYFPCSYLCL